MKAKTTIDERISKLREQISKKEFTLRKHQDIVNSCNSAINKKIDKIRKLEVKKAKQQKDQVIGDKLVESGIITEQQNQEIQGLPVQEKKENPPIYDTEA